MLSSKLHPVRVNICLKFQRCIAEDTPIILESSLEEHTRETPASPDVSRRYLHLLELSIDCDTQLAEDSVISDISEIPSEEVASANDQTYIVEEPSVIILESSMEEDSAVFAFFYHFICVTLLGCSV